MPSYFPHQVWTPREFQDNLDHAYVSCALYGYHYWFDNEYRAFSASLRMFDYQTEWINRPDNRFQPTEKDKTDRRALLAKLHDQFSQFCNMVRLNDLQMRQNVQNEQQIEVITLD